ncbi:MAG: hypothetical protein JWL90_98 [Chthoniobacteraceae bacterium]|nr:hypothetical protein [Chthoniobacteraceae bacterium]
MKPVPPVPAKKQKFRFKWWHKLIASKFLLISIFVHLFFGVGATYYVVQQIKEKRKLTFAEGPPANNASSRALEHKVSMAKKKNTMSAPAQAKRITTTGISRIALPDMPTMPHATEVIANRMAGLGGVGNGFGTGGGGGMGTGGGGFGFALPKAMNDRCSAAARANAMRLSGGNPKSEEAILKALRWLKQNQNPDGSFGQQYPMAMTGLALLSFMGHCERPTSQEFGDCVRKMIDFLVQGAGTDGKLSRIGGNEWVYEHGIATYALGETYSLTHDKKVEPVFKKAVEIIVRGQGNDGGWMYNFDKSKSDTSVSGWQIQSLKVAHLSGLNIEGVEEAMKKAMGNIRRVKGPKGGYGYRDPEDKWGLTGVGALCLQIGGSGGSDVGKAIRFIMDDPASPKIKYGDGGANLYAWYYATQAAFQHGGSIWQRWNKEFQMEVVGSQSDNGAWPETGGVGKGGGALNWVGTGTGSDAQVYRTSLCILMLEVYYRYLANVRS